MLATLVQVESLSLALEHQAAAIPERYGLDLE
jgi:hypothetical protein